jgi:tight adherence protein C
MPASSSLIALSFFLLIVTACFTLYFGVYADRVRADERLLAISSAAVDRDLRSVTRSLLDWILQRMPALKLDTSKGRRVAETLSQAGYSGPVAVRMYQLTRLVAVVVCVLAAWSCSSTFSGPLRLLAGVFGGVAGNAFPAFYIGRRAKARKARIARELSEILDLLVVCVEAGLGIFQAVRVVGQEAHRQGRALGSELSVVSREITAGSTLGQAFRAMAQRTGVDDVKSLAAILIQSEKLGSQMAPALRAISDQLRAKRRLRAEEAAYKCAVKMLIPLVLFVMPSMMAVILGPAMVQILQGMPA